ncbi:G2E3 ligase, partial [Trogon melanurus]|nr:G2E3 ligase [Trogon melanurus]
CIVCGESGASITCCLTFCDHSFHLPCAARGRCVTQFFGHYMAFCSDHSPQQVMEAAWDEETSCLICPEPLDDGLCFNTMVCPACKHAWFHRGCIQGLALSTGLVCFQCPLCRDRDLFLLVMLIMGIQIPDRLPTWESGQAYDELMERRRRCDAGVCQCPGGREQAEEDGPWQLLRCSSCAGQGTHRGCSNLGNSTTCWECEVC